MTAAREFTGRPAWFDDAACRHMGPAMFFPDSHEHTTGQTARQICAECPVRAECATDGLWEPYGIWGGTGERDRQQARRGRQRPKPPFPHGTMPGYDRHRREGTEPCRRCRHARVEYKERLKHGGDAA